MTRITFERDVATNGDGRGVRLSNGDVELVAATSFGLRVMRFGFPGGRNVLGWVDPATQGVPVAGGTWHIYGGHRLWAAPEDAVRTYAPDNAPVHAALQGSSLVLTQPVEPTGLVKEMRLTLAESGPEVMLEHRITNANEAPTELALWSLSVMTTGGVALLPGSRFVPHPEGLLPVRRLVLWPYSDLSDPRFRFSSRMLRVRQDARATAPQKVGVFDTERGWAGYAMDGLLFVKRYALPLADDDHADLGCNVEVFTNPSMLELETLGPRVVLRRGETAVHRERWSLHALDVPDDDAEAERVVEGLLGPT